MGREAPQPLSKAVVENLQSRFPNVPLAEIKKALKQCNNHGGKALTMLQQKYDLKSVQQKEAEDRDKAEAVILLKEARHQLHFIDKGVLETPVVAQDTIDELQQLIPEVPEERIIMAVFFSEHDFTSAKKWLWQPDQGAGARRRKATSFTEWTHASEGDLATFSTGSFTTTQLILDRRTGSYSYTETAWAEISSKLDDVAADRGVKYLKRRSQAFGKWALESFKPGYTLMLRGRMTEEQFEPSLNRETAVLRSSSEESHVQLFCTTKPPFKDLPADRPDELLSIEDKLKVRFRELDQDASGFLSKDELAVLLKKSGDMSDDEVACLFSAVDTDGNGEVSYEEFIDFVYAKAPTKEIYMEVLDDLGGSVVPSS